jgi:hypothetical protein
MKPVNGWRLAKVTQEQRVALHEVFLRGAARNYADNLDTQEEESASAKLREAAIGYASALLQRACSETSALSHAPGPKPRGVAKKDEPQ